MKPKDRVTFMLDGNGVRVVPLGSRLAEGFASVPPLQKPLSLREMEKIAGDEIARNAAAEGL